MVKLLKSSRRRIVVAAGAVPLYLAACVSPTTETSGSAVGTPSRQAASLRVGGYTEGHQTNTERNIAHYRKERPEVSLSFEMMTPYFEKLQATVLAGTQPDIFIMNGPNFLHYAT